MTDASPPRPTAPWRRFAAARGGVAAVEFALLVPVVLAMMAAAVDLTQAISIKRKLVEIAYTASDLVAQRSDLTAADVSSILTGSSAIRTCGVGASARAIAMRWRCPPENSCG